MKRPVSSIKYFARFSIRGLPNRIARCAVADFRQPPGENPRWDLVILDFDYFGNARVLFSGRTAFTANLEEIFCGHRVLNLGTVINATSNTEEVYSLCLSREWSAYRIEEARKTWLHSDGTRRFYSEPELLWTVARNLAEEDSEPNAPVVFSISQPGALELLSLQRASRKYEAPSDAPEDLLAAAAVLADQLDIVNAPKPKENIEPPMGFTS